MKKITFLIILTFILITNSVEIFAETLQEKLVERQGIAYMINTEVPFSGMAVEYHDNGQLASRLFYKNGLADGTLEIFFDNGQLKTIQKFSKGKLLPGVYKYLRKTGTIHEEITVVDDITKYHRVFSNDGELTTKGRTLNNKRDGVWEFYDNNNLWEKTQYKLGKVNGLSESYYENGKLKSKGNCTSKFSVCREKQGLWEFYDQDGELEAKRTYKDDRPLGYFKERYIDPLNNLPYWREGEKNGKIDVFNEDGILVESYQSDGWRVNYNPDGSIESTRCYAKGRHCYGVCNGVLLEDFSGVTPGKEVVIPKFVPTPKHPFKARKYCGIATVEFEIDPYGDVKSLALKDEVPKGMGFGKNALEVARELEYKYRSCRKKHTHTFFFEKRKCKNLDEIESLLAKALELDTTYNTDSDELSLPIYVPEPRYPYGAYYDEVEGYVVVEFTITKTGGVRKIKLIEEYPEGYSFASSAMEVASQLRYKPQFIAGKFIEVPAAQYRFNFSRRR